jgi:gliding motility-associated-like protein
MRLFTAITFLFLLNHWSFAQQNHDTAPFTTKQGFIENKGQFDGRSWRGETPILYSVSHNPFNIYFSPDGWTYRFDKIIKNPKRKEDPTVMPKRLNISELIQVHWLGSNPNVEVVAEGKYAPYFTFGVFDENKKETAISGIHSYDKITYKNLYDHIDVEYIIHPEGGIKYNILLHPGADPSIVKLKYSSAHTNTQGERIAIGLNSAGEVEIKTSLGEITEKAPVSFYADGTPIASRYIWKDNVLSFELTNYDNSKAAVIDPWIVSPNFQTSTAVWEVETDSFGNVYSIGGETPMELKKYDINGNLQWTYVTPWDTNNVWLGTLATDPDGNSFVTSGTSPTIQRVNTNGGLVWSNNHTTMNGPSEFWSITFNCDYTKLIVGGTEANIALFINDFWGAIYDIDINNGNILNTQLFELVSVNLMNPPTGIFLDTPIEVRSVASSKNSQYVYLTHTKVGKITDNFSFCGNNPPIFDEDNQRNLGYKCENFLPETQNGGGLKGIIAGEDYFYTHSGDEIRQWDILTGDLINVAPIPGGSSNTVPLIGGHVMHCSGLAVDDCNNIYAGSMNQVVQYDANLNILSTQPTSFNVYDVSVNSNGEVIAAGAQQNNAAVNRNGRIEALNFSACSQFAIICCDPNFCNPGPLCETDPAVTIDFSQPGGTWSGPGVNASGVFDPAIAGPGEHMITYTLPCGELSQSVVVSPCQPLEACINANGTVTITNGVGTIVWEETLAPSSSPITNQAECENCGFTWLAGFPPLLPSQCLDGVTQVTTCNNPGGLTQFATGVTVMPTSNLPIIVTDGAGFSITINDLNALDSCSTTPCTNLTVTVSNQTNVSCNGDSNGTATVTASGGNGNYTYTWSPGGMTGATQTGLAAGQYTVDVVDTDDCAGSVIVTITEPTAIVLNTTITDAACGATDGAVNLTVSGGNPPYLFSWSNGASTQNLTNVSPGSYSVDVTDANGCTATITANVSATDGPEINLVNSTDVSCFSANDGSATVSATGGAGGNVFVWQPGGLTGPSQTGLSAGTYTVTVTDSEGCPASLTVTISQPAAIVLDLTSLPSACDVDDGSVSVVATGGAGGFSYLWSNSATTSTVNGLGAGIYNVTVTDAQGCQATGSVTVVNANGPTVEIVSFTDETCAGSSDGTATAVASGGTPGYNYSWAPSGGNNATATSLTTGNYTVTVTDDEGCSAFASITIGSGAIDVEIIPNSAVINSGDEVILQVVVDPTTSGAVFNWTPSEGLSCTDCQNPIASPSQTTTYIVNVVTPDGCTGTDSVTIFVNDPCVNVALPTIFSPNGDGNNDTFCALGDCFQTMHLRIFNRWGELMFESTNPDNCWDGTHRDKPVNSGVYVYTFVYVDLDGNQQVLSGNVTLLR